MPRVKLLFLDIDGVLLHFKDVEPPDNLVIPSHRHYKGRDYPASIDKSCVERVNRICNEIGCKVVLSSTWRLLGDVRQTGEYLANQFGATFELEMHTSPRVDRRHKEIDEFLNLYKRTFANFDTLESFVIIDDESCPVDHPLHKNWVHIKDGINQGGILDQHVEQAIQILENKKKED